MRYTIQHVTLNTNHAGNTAAEVQDVIGKLRRFVAYDLAQIDNWRPLLRVSPDFDVVENILVDAVGIEVGPRRHLIHVHFVVTIEHRGRVSVIGRGSQAWQQLLRSRLPFVRGAYAKVRLIDGRSLNYTAKTTNREEPTEQLASLGLQQPVVF